MSVVNVKKSWQLSYGISTDGRTASEVYTVLLDAVPVSVAIVALAAGIPRVDDTTYPGDDWMVCSEVNPVATGPMYYTVTVNYEKVGSGDDETPMQADAKFSWSKTTTTEPKDFDVNGKPIVNSVDERVDPPLAFEVVDRILKYSKNVATYNVQARSEYDNVTNSDEFLGWPAGTVLCRPIDATIKRPGNQSYYRESYEFWFRKGVPVVGGTGGPAKAWYRRWLNQGLRSSGGTNDDGSRRFAPILDSQNNPITEPVNLAADGTPLVVGDPVIWNETQQYGEKDLNALGISLT